MKQGIRLVALGVAVAVNAAALGAVHLAMGNSGSREAMESPEQGVEQVVVIARRQDLAEVQPIALKDCRDGDSKPL